MRCGKGHDHETVAEVRACYGQSGSVAVLDYRENKYAGECVKCHQTVAANSGRIDKNAEGRWDVSHLTGECPETVAVEGEGTIAKRDYDVPAGHYAVESITGNNDLDFFRVDRPTEGRWDGYTFVKRVIGGKPDTPVRGATRDAALSAIVEMGVEESRARYGQKVGRCGICNRHLTDKLSRDRGIGPDCWAKLS